MFRSQRDICFDPDPDHGVQWQVSDEEARFAKSTQQLVPCEVLWPHLSNRSLLSFASLVRCAAVCTQWRAAVSARYVTLHGCYKDHTLHDIHAADEKEGLLEWL